MIIDIRLQQNRLWLVRMQKMKEECSRERVRLWSWEKEEYGDLEAH